MGRYGTTSCGPCTPIQSGRLASSRSKHDTSCLDGRLFECLRPSAVATLIMLSAENPDKNDRLRLAAQGDAESWAALVSGSRIEDELGSRLEI